MVDNTAEKTIPQELFIDIPEEVLNWSSISLSEIRDQDWRLEARYFNIEGKHARELLDKCKWSVVNLWSDNGFVKNAQYPGRFKRIYVERDGIPFLLPSQISEINPKATKFISEKMEVRIDDLKAKKGNILLTRSGTTGNLTFVSNTLDGMVFSDDVIRIELINPHDAGYVYAFLRSRTGQILISTNNYGAVVSHIEPEHLKHIPIPNPEESIKAKLYDLVQGSFNLRDLSNEFIDEAEKLLTTELNLPTIQELCSQTKAELSSYAVKLSSMDERFDASYHVPVVDTIMKQLKVSAAEMTVLGDGRISKRIILPGRFKRVYLEEGQGRVFFGGKQIHELDPSNKKYLSLIHHEKRIKEQLQLEENMVMITSSGTIGKVTIAPKHWEGWTANQHIIRVVPSSNEIAGYIFSWLNSEYGYQLIKRFKYGAVVDEIDANQVSQIQIPILKDKEVQQKINSLVLEANQKRYQAYVLEQEALKLVNDSVIYAQ